MLGRFKRIERLTHLLETTLMATLADVITALNDNTNAVAARMDALLAEIATLQAAGQPPTADQLATLQAISDHLKQIGANPTNPVPPAFPAGSTDAKAAPVASVQGPAVGAQTLAETVPVAPQPAPSAPVASPLSSPAAE